MGYLEKRNQIDLLQEKINSYGKLNDEVRRKINYKFRLDWNYYSNSMEGNTLTMEETRSVMIGNLTVGGKPIKDVLEIRGHDKVIDEILKIGKGEIRLSEARIKEIHKGIMHEEDEDKKIKIGKWKTEQNYIYNYKNERFDFAPPEDVPERMHNLLNKTNAAIDSITHNKKNKYHPVDIALQYHLDYVIIHPFYDGNGRTARILTNLLLISFGYPPFWVKTDERKIYNQYIGDIQGYGGSSDLFFDYVTDMILRSQQLMLDAIEGKEIEEQSDLDKELTLLQKELKGEDVLKAKASAENICIAIETNIIPMFKLVEDKCEGLNEFFFDKKRAIIYETEGGSGNSDAGTNDNNWLEIKENWLDNKIRKSGSKVRHIQYTFELKGFKKTVTGSGFWLDINVWFNDYNYAIETIGTNKPTIQIPYEKKLSQKELQDIITPSIKVIIENIKQLNGTINNKYYAYIRTKKSVQ